jgi:hypothetical protein
MLVCAPARLVIPLSRHWLEPVSMWAYAPRATEFPER